MRAAECRSLDQRTFWVIWQSRRVVLFVCICPQNKQDTIFFLYLARGKLRRKVRAWTLILPIFSVIYSISDKAENTILLGIIDFAGIWSYKNLKNWNVSLVMVVIKRQCVTGGKTQHRRCKQGYQKNNLAMPIMISWSHSCSLLI